jgi:hypothetical protein
MPQWVNRTVLSGSSVDKNGTNSHTCTFTAATSGNFLVAVVSGSVTFTTPAGWTNTASTVGNSGLYAFTKTASAAESSFSTTHNDSNYPIRGVVYEFYAGTSVQNSNSANSQSSSGTVNGPAVSSLSGTYSRFAARSQSLGVDPTDTASCAWTLPTTEDYDTYFAKVTGEPESGIFLTIAYDDFQTGSSFTPSSAMTSDDVGTTEAVAFALTVASPPTTIPLAWVQGVNSP